MLDSERSELRRRLDGAATLAVLVFLGVVAYVSAPMPGLASRGVIICGSAFLGGACTGWAVARIFRGTTPDPLVDGIAFWAGALVTYPAFRYFHDNTDWALHPGAGEYSLGQHALAVLIPAGLFVLGQMARRR